MVLSHLIIPQERRLLAVFDIHTNALVLHVLSSQTFIELCFFLILKSMAKCISTNMVVLDNCHQRISPEAEQFQISPGEVLKALLISLSH